MTLLVSTLPDLWNETFHNVNSTLVAAWDSMPAVLASMCLVVASFTPVARRGWAFRGKAGNGRSVPIPTAGG